MPALKLSPRQNAIVEAFLDSRAKPFRRGDLSALLYPTTSPRSGEKAAAYADTALRALAKAGRVVRDGHLHWKVVVAQRRLLSGTLVPERDQPQSLTLTTKAPQKWLALDLETGELWAGSNSGWKRADAAARQAARQALKAPPAA
jgi:hypothetical protein